MSNVDNVYHLERGVPDDGTDPVAVVGGKAANLTRLRDAGFPVPDGFVVTADAYRRFLEATGIADDLADAIDVDSHDHDALDAAAARARQIITDTDPPETLQKGLRAAYAGLEADSVAVRSSATAEDLPEASFAGQQETYLNVAGEDAVVERVRDCWASLFTERALEYRARMGFDDGTVGIAVVVQKMVDAEKSGVLFTADPTTGDAEMTVEAAWGLGEAVVAGEVSPDSYVIDRDTAEVVSETISTKKVMHDRDPETGETREREVPEEKRDVPALSDDELEHLREIGERIEDHYGSPQDVEWAIRDSEGQGPPGNRTESGDGEVLVLQSRPITTIDEDGDTAPEDDERDAADPDDDALTGLNASEGVAEGAIYFDPVEAAKAEKRGEDVVLVRKMTSPSDVHGMKAANGILTSQGGKTCHAAIVARELEKPAVVGCDALDIDYDAETVSVDGRTYAVGDRVRVDGTNGTVEFLK